MAKKSFFKSEIFIMIAIIMFLLFAIVVLFAYNKNKIMESFTGESNIRYIMEYYYMEDCYHCKEFNRSGVWKKLNDNYGNSIIEFKKYNSQDYKDRVDKYNIKGYPTIIMVDKTTEKNLEEYNGDRSYENMKVFVDKYINMV